MRNITVILDCIKSYPNGKFLEVAMNLRFIFVVLESERRALHMLSISSSTELQPQPLNLNLCYSSPFREGLPKNPA
jgi:hypothetical protein